MTDDLPIRGEGTQVGGLILRPIEVVQINDFIYMATGLANIYVVTTPEGHVLIDTGMGRQAEPMHDKLKSAIPEGPITHMIIPQAQHDDIGGVDLWREEGTKIVMPRESWERMKWRASIWKGIFRRQCIFYPWALKVPEPAPGTPRAYRVIEPTVIVENHDTYEFELGGIQFQVFWLPGAEGINSGGVWLPQYKILFCSGGFTGPVWPMWPNFGTLRGDRGRLVLPYIDSLNRALELEPEMLLQEQVMPINDKDEIRNGLTLIRDGLVYLHDAVIQGLNDGKSVYELMKEITIPPKFEKLSQEHGKVPWIIRSIVDQYGFWFQCRSTTELHPIPVWDIYNEIAEMTGIEALIKRASEHAAAGRPIESIHFLEIALAKDPDNQEALRINLDIHKRLLEDVRQTTNNFQEIAWLEAQIRQTEERLQ